MCVLMRLPGYNRYDTSFYMIEKLWLTIESKVRIPFYFDSSAGCILISADSFYKAGVRL